jgi:hypothetical protein
MKTDDEFDENGVVRDGRRIRVPMMMMDSLQRSVAASDGLARSHEFAAAFRRAHDRRKTLDAALGSDDPTIRAATRAGLAAAPVADALAASHRHAATFRAAQTTRATVASPIVKDAAEARAGYVNRMESAWRHRP